MKHTKRILVPILVFLLAVMAAAPVAAAGSDVPSPDDVLNQLGGGKSINANQTMTALVAKLVAAIKFVQSWMGVIVLVVVIIGAILAGLGMAFNNRDLKRNGVGTIIGAVFAYGLVRLAPVVIALLMRST
ncbi:MAG: hypothetical protein ACYC37_08680 [Desulfobacteria bacterium]